MISIKKSYYVLTIGVLMNISAYVGLMTLQSSINIEHNLGTITASIMYISAAFLGLFLSPILILRLGIKWSLILGETGFLCYTIANFYPKFEVLIPGALLGSFGEALIWSASPIFINYLLRKYWPDQQEFDSSITEEMVRNKWLANFLAVLKFCSIFGNLLSYGVLYGGRNFGQISNLSLFENVSHCGANFDVKNVRSNSDLNKYIPQNKLSIYLLLSVYLGLQIISVLLHSYFIPSLQQDIENPSVLKHISNTLVSTFKHIKSPPHILLVPLYVYYGLLISYTMGVFSRAFVSCSLGVQIVGLVMAVQGAFNILMTIIAGKLSYRYGTTPLVIFAFVYDLLNYSIQLTWKINENNRYYVILLSASSGIADGTWQLTIFSYTALCFNDRQEIAYSVESFWCVVGMFTGFMLASSVRVNIHIYILMVMLILGCIGYGTIKYIKYKESFLTDEKSLLIRKSSLESEVAKASGCEIKTESRD